MLFFSLFFFFLLRMKSADAQFSVIGCSLQGEESFAFSVPTKKLRCLQFLYFFISCSHHRTVECLQYLYFLFPPDEIECLPFPVSTKAKSNVCNVYICCSHQRNVKCLLFLSFLFSPKESQMLAVSKLLVLTPPPQKKSCMLLSVSTKEKCI